MGATLTLHVVNLLFDFFPSFSFLVILSNSFLFVFILFFYSFSFFFILFHSFSFFFILFHSFFFTFLLLFLLLSILIVSDCIVITSILLVVKIITMQPGGWEIFFYFLNLFFNHCANWWLDGEDLVVPEYIYRSLSQSMMIWISWLSAPPLLLSSIWPPSLPTFSAGCWELNGEDLVVPEYRYTYTPWICPYVSFQGKVIELSMFNWVIGIELLLHPVEPFQNL